MLAWTLIAVAVAAPGGQVVVSASPGADLADAAVLSQRPLVRRGERAGHRLGAVRVLTVAGDPREVAARLAQRPGVRWAEADAAGTGGGLPDDPYFGMQWSLSNDGTFSEGAVEGADIDAPGAWDLEMGSPQIVVAVLDTGGPVGEADLPNLWENPGEIPGNGRDDDDNGYVDDATGWDFTTDTPNTKDVDGHGSNVLGIVGARGGNGTGYAGVCGGCTLMVVQALDDTSYGYYSWWAEAIAYAVDEGAAVINLSLGGTDASEVLAEAVEYAHDNGVVVVACMMNDDADAPYYPAAFDSVIAVGATDPRDWRATPFSWGGGSNYGGHIDVVAPGATIHGLSPKAGEYGEWYWSGTSQAAPHVAGIAGLLLSAEPSLTPDDVALLLEGGAADQVGSPDEDEPGWDRYYGHGRVDARRSLELLEEWTPGQDTGRPDDTGGCEDCVEAPIACACRTGSPAALSPLWAALALLWRKRR